MTFPYQTSIITSLFVILNKTNHSDYRSHLNLFLHVYIILTFVCGHWSNPQGALERQLKCNKLLHLLLLQSIGIIKILSCWEEFCLCPERMAKNH